jgi:hypothetical protein
VLSSLGPWLPPVRRMSRQDSFPLTA